MTYSSNMMATAYVTAYPLQTLIAAAPIVCLIGLLILASREKRVVTYDREDANSSETTGRVLVTTVAFLVFLRLSFALTKEGSTFDTFLKEPYAKYPLGALAIGYIAIPIIRIVACLILAKSVAMINLNGPAAQERLALH